MAFKFPFEIKPYWKFHFLNKDGGTDVMIEEWEMPHGYSKADIKYKRSLPGDWSQSKCKVLHLSFVRFTAKWLQLIECMG
jgi:hypothetical protein